VTNSALSSKGDSLQLTSARKLIISWPKQRCTAPYKHGLIYILELLKLREYWKCSLIASTRVFREVCVLGVM